MPAPSAPAAPPPVAAPAAPAKPAAAPPAPKAAPKPVQPPPESDSGDWMAEESLELDGLDDNNKPPRPAPKEKAQEEPKEEQPSEEPKPKVDKPEETPEAEREEPEPEAPDPSKMPARDLRKAYEANQKKIRDELQPKIQKLEARLKEVESSSTEPSALANQFKAVSEENKQLRDKLAERDYQEHPEYKEKQGKFVAEFDRARRNLFQLEVDMADGQTRKVTDEDILLLANLPYGKDRAEANKMFGDAAEDVLHHTRKIRELAEDQQNWVEENKKTASQKSEERAATMKAENIQRAKAFIEVNNELAEKFPYWFKPKEGDEEGNRTLAAGEAVANLGFGLKLTPDQVALLPKRFKEEMERDGKLSPDSTLRLHALIRNKAMNHDRIARWMKSMRAELKAAKESLAQYEQSEPPTGGVARKRGGTGVPGVYDDENAEIDEISRRSR